MIIAIDFDGTITKEHRYPRIAAHYYIDDRAFGGTMDWNIIEEHLC